MKRIVTLNSCKFHRSVQSNASEIVPGPIRDHYLPTIFSKKEKAVTVFGSSGFLGQYVVSELDNGRYQLILPFRGDVHDIKHVRMIGGVGQNLFMPFSVYDENSIEKAIMHSDGVINLIGRDFQNSHFSFDELHVEVAAKIARVAKRMGVSHYIHLSALGATEKPVPYLLKSGSQFLRSKWLGEHEVRREFPGVTIFRPSNIWGFNDRFIYYFTHRKRQALGRKIIIPMWKLGQETVKQPIYAEDVAKSISKVLFNDKYQGRTLELVGPQRFQLDHLVQWFYLHKKHNLGDIIIREMSQWFLLKAKYHHLLTAHIPHMTEEDLERECITDHLSGCLTIDDLGIRPCKLEDRIQWLLKPNRCAGYRWDDQGGFDPPPAPPLAID